MKKVPSVFLAGKLLFLFCLLMSKNATSQRDTLMVATYRYADNDRIANITPLAGHLGQQLNHPVRVRSYGNVHDFVNALQNDEADIALINTFGYLLLDAAAKDHNMIPVAVLQPKAGTQDNYKTAILAGENAGITSMAALPQMARQLRFAFVSPGSTSGNLVPRLALSRLGLSMPEEKFLQVSYSGNHRAGIDSLLANKVDICAVGSTEYFKLVADSSRSDQYKLLWLSPEIPLGPVLLHKRLSSDVRRKITASLLSLHEQNVIAFNAVKQGWSEAKEAEKYVRFSKNYYKPFLKQIGSKPATRMILAQFAN